MKRVKLVVAYDGTNYCGWQQQPNGVTIEELLNRELSRLLGEDIQVIGASRTDSGVHAWGNLAVFDTNARMPADKICIALNQRLPKDIVIQESSEIASDWHPRKCNSRKTYEYRILNRRVPFPAERLNSYFYYYDLDVEAMQRAAACLVGEHDFKSFCSIRTQAEDTVRRIYSLDIKKHGDRIDIRICGNGFLYNMVRIIVGSLIKVGSGFWEPERMKQILEARDRSKAGPKAPAHGLTLISIEEEKQLPDMIEEENEHWSYRLIQREIPSYGQAYLTIRSCEEADFDRLLLRLVKQASRNGARGVHVRDLTGRLREGYQAGYFTFRERYEIRRMACRLPLASGDGRDRGGPLFEPVTAYDEGRLETAVRLEGETFAQVPNGCPITKDELQKEILGGQLCYLVRTDQEAAGFFQLKAREKCLELEAIGIRADFRGRGIGGACIRFAAEKAAAMGFDRLELIAADNNPAVRLYERMGFQSSEVLSVWYSTRDEKRSRQEEETEEAE